MIGSQALTRWAAENVGDVVLDFDANANRIVKHADDIIALRDDWFHNHGMGDMFHDDGTLWLDHAGWWRYKKIHDLPDGRTAYYRTNGNPGYTAGPTGS